MPDTSYWAKRKQREEEPFIGERQKGYLGGQRTETYQPDVFIPARKDDPNVPLIKGTKKGAKVDRMGMDEPNRRAAANQAAAIAARKKRRWYNPFTWGGNGT